VRSCGPARDSGTALTNWGEAEPSKRKRVFFWGRSTRTRRSSNSSGWRCTSSMTSNSERASRLSRVRRGAGYRQDFPGQNTYIGLTFCQDSCEGRLATLARTKESRNGVHAEGTGDFLEGFWSWYHGHLISLEIGMPSNDFQGLLS